MSGNEREMDEAELAWHQARSCDTCPPPSRELAAAREAEQVLQEHTERLLQENLARIRADDALAQPAEDAFADFWGGQGADWEAQAAKSDPGGAEVEWPWGRISPEQQARLGLEAGG